MRHKSEKGSHVVRRSDSSSPLLYHAQVLRQELRETLEGGPSAKALLDYIKRKRDYPELVLFYLEILDFKEIMTGFLRDQQNAPAGKATHSFRYFLMRANKIYDKYLKLGSSLRVSGHMGCQR